MAVTRAASSVALTAALMVGQLAAQRVESLAVKMAGWMADSRAVLMAAKKVHSSADQMVALLADSKAEKLAAQKVVMLGANLVVPTESQRAENLAGSRAASKVGRSAAL